MAESQIRVMDLSIGYGSYVVQQGLNFSVLKGDVFAIMGESGCGKSTLLRHLVGLQQPMSGQMFYGDTDYWSSEAEQQMNINRRFGVMFQSGALWSSLTLAENVGLPLGEFTQLSPRQIADTVSLKLALVGLSGFEEYYPSELSGGMRIRAGIARAMALDPDILFLDEPSAGLDPVTSGRLDDLILALATSLETTVVVVTHELASIFSIANNGIFLDAKTKTLVASGNPREMLQSENETVQAFFARAPKMVPMEA